MAYDCDLLVIGSGPAGQKAAVQASKIGARVVIVDRGHMVGGVCTNTGTVPSKTLREAVLHLTGLRHRAIYGQSYRVKQEITIDDLFRHARHVIAAETEVIRDQLARNHIELVSGVARFVDPHTLAVAGDGSIERRIAAARVVVAVGTRPARPSTVAFDEQTVLDSDGILGLNRIPTSLVVVGGGVIGLEYASMFAPLGVKVTVIDQREQLLEFCDRQIVEALKYHLGDLGVTFLLGETVVAVERHVDTALTVLASGKRILGETVLYSAGRQGATDDLELQAAGLEADARGRIVVNSQYRTKVKHIWAVGDVIGFPSLAATSMEQGRLAACDAFGITTSGASSSVLPIGIYSIPEISYVGRTEEELTKAAVPYETGLARYRELARGRIAGDVHGLLKLLVSPVDRSILGVHVFGTGATEVVHVGQAVIALGGTVDHLVENVFNYPTLAEGYKVAALDATNKLRALERAAG